MQAIINRLGESARLAVIVRTALGRSGQPAPPPLIGADVSVIAHPMEVPGWTRSRLPAALARWTGKRPLSGVPEAESGLVICFDLLRFEAAQRLAEERGWPLVTDLMDDWRLHASMPAWHVHLENRVLPRLARSGLITAATELAATPYTSLVVPNAGHHEGAPTTSPSPAPERPVAAYVGMIHPRIDADLLLRVKSELPEWDVEVAGPVMDRALATRLERSGVRLHPWWEMDCIAERASVMVCPYARTPFAKSGDPLKIYEATARGVACVSTIGVGAPPSVGLLIAGPDDFVDAVRAARELDREEIMRAARATGSWEQRASMILGRLAPSLTAPGPLLAP